MNIIEILNEYELGHEINNDIIYININDLKIKIWNRMGDERFSNMLTDTMNINDVPHISINTLLSIMEKESLSKRASSLYDKLYVLYDDDDTNTDMSDDDYDLSTLPLKVGDNIVSAITKIDSRYILFKNISSCIAGIYLLDIMYSITIADIEYKLYKCGHTTNLIERLESHDKTYGKLNVVHFQPVMASYQAEKKMLELFTLFGIAQPTKIINGKSKRELLILGTHTIDNIIDIMEIAANSTIEDKDVLIEKEKTIQEKIKLKLKEQDTLQEIEKSKQEEFKYKTMILQTQLSVTNDS